MSARDKRLEDFSAALDWIKAEGFEVVVIGGMAVGKYATVAGQAVLSGDLDLLATTEQQMMMARQAVKVPGVRVEKLPQPRSAPVLVLDWRGLEIDVLSESRGLPPPSQAHARAWDFDGLRVVDPVDLLANKLAVSRAKDLPHIPIVRTFCEFAALRAFETAPERSAVDLLDRWAQVEGWETLPVDLFNSLLAICAASSPAGRKFLVRRAPSRSHADAVVAASPEGEWPQLRSIAAACHG